MACGICGGAGHNRRTCSAGGGGGGGGSSSYGGGYSSYSSPSSYSYSSPSRYSSPTTKRTITCGGCGQQGHDIRTCSGGSSNGRSTNHASAIASSSSYGGYGNLAATTPKRTVTCSGCGQQGHNIRTCTVGFSSSRSTSTGLAGSILGKNEVSTPTRTVSCGTCGKSGHNSRTCTAGSSRSSISSVSTANIRTVTCGLCGQPGHNRRTCVVGSDLRNTTTSSTSFTAVTRTITCGICGETGHNRRACTVGSDSRSTICSNHASSCGIRTVTCGLCGQTGHNRRTCTADSVITSSNNSIISAGNTGGTRTVTCGNCGKKGHNRRTCNAGVLSDSFGSSTPGPEHSGTKTVTCGICGQPGHNRRTCKLRQNNDDSLSSKLGGTSENVKSSQKSTVGTTHCSTCGETGHNRRTCKFDVNNNCSDTETLDDFISNFQDELNSKSISKANKKTSCKTCGEWGHDTKSCAFGSKWEEFLEKAKDRVSSKKFETSKDKNILLGKDEPCKEKSAPAKSKQVSEINGSGNADVASQKQTSHLRQTWQMNEAAEKRFQEGPTVRDGPGNIYIYKFKNPPRNAENEFKIGMTAGLPNRRVHCQETKNGEEYQIVRTFQTPFRYLTDIVIKRQLEKYNRPREEDVDGKTEWFVGPLNNFISTIQNIIRDVNHGNFESTIATA